MITPKTATGLRYIFWFCNQTIFSQENTRNTTPVQSANYIPSNSPSNEELPSLAVLSLYTVGEIKRKMLKTNWRTMIRKIARVDLHFRGYYYGKLWTKIVRYIEKLAELLRNFPYHCLPVSLNALFIVYIWREKFCIFEYKNTELLVEWFPVLLAFNWRNCTLPWRKCFYSHSCQ